MPSLRIESAEDVLDLSSIELTGFGVQVLAGVTGLGLPPVQQQWLDGAGDGSTNRGKRVLARDIDLPLYVLEPDREALKDRVSQLSRLLADKATLYFVDDDRAGEWYADVYRVGGGDYSYGVDTAGNRDMSTVVTVRAGDPYWTSTQDVVRAITSGAALGLLTGSLANLGMSPSQAIGDIRLDNSGDVPTFPVWTITGPGTNFVATSAKGEVLRWTGTLGLGETLILDARNGTVVDGTGANRYDGLAPSPRFWSVPQGTTVATAALGGTTPGVSAIQVAWRPRKWLVI